MKGMRVLLLGGTSEASKLARLLAGRPNLDCLLSFAGRTKTPLAPPVPFRIGGFGGIDGLVAFLAAQEIDLLVDATHPFAEQMSQNAEAAAKRAGIPLVVVQRPPWTREPGDQWIEVADMAQAAQAIGAAARRVFLTIGRLQLAAFEAAPQHSYLIRTIETAEVAPNLPSYRVIPGLGPFSQDDEDRLLREERIEVLVTKNSGGEATRAKILAARNLGLPVVMVQRPNGSSNGAFHDPAEALDFILDHCHASAPRGE
jgi:precorrin-6A/cobalt-precorrin-6A reductase